LIKRIPMALRFFWTCEDCADNLARLPYFKFLESWYPSAKYERYPELEIKSDEKYYDLKLLE